VNWQIDFHNRALKFLKTSKISQDEIIEVVKKALRKLQGKDINIDIAKLKGEWRGFHRIKIGKLRIVAEFNFDIKREFILKLSIGGAVHINENF